METVFSYFLVLVFFVGLVAYLKKKKKLVVESQTSVPRHKNEGQIP